MSRRISQLSSGSPALLSEPCTPMAPSWPSTSRSRRACRTCIRTSCLAAKATACSARRSSGCATAIPTRPRCARHNWPLLLRSRFLRSEKTFRERVEEDGLGHARGLAPVRRHGAHLRLRRRGAKSVRKTERFADTKVARDDRWSTQRAGEDPLRRPAAYPTNLDQPLDHHLVLQRLQIDKREAALDHRSRRCHNRDRLTGSEL